MLLSSILSIWIKLHSPIVRRGITTSIILLFGLLQSPAHASNVNEWKISSRNFATDTAGYLYPDSVLPGTKVSAYITCPAGNFSLTAYRMGSYSNDSQGFAYWKSEELPCLKQKKLSIDPVTGKVFADWVSNAAIPTNDLYPGFYLIKIESQLGHAAFMNLTVRSEDVTGSVVIVIPTMTNAAYNRWGGPSAYRGKKGFEDRARVLSMDRPNSLGFGSGKYLNYVHPLVVEAESAGISTAYVTDVDLASDPQSISGASAIIFGGHDEYWTLQERNTVIKARKLGTNTIFFGANTAYWRVRLSPSTLGENREVEIYKSAKSDPVKGKATIRFRDLGFPESELTGQEYNCFPANGNFVVTVPDSFIYADTKVGAGSSFKGIIGPEVDHFVGTGKSFIASKVLSRSPVVCGQKTESTSTVTYSITDSGAGSISIGSMKWVERGLTTAVSDTTRTFVKQVTRNILVAASLGPLGVNYPI